MPMNWDEYRQSLDWNNTDAVRGFQALANKVGYSGPVQERTGRQKFDFEGESGPVYSDEWGPAAGLSQAMGGYQFGSGLDGSGNPVANVYNGDGSMLDSARVGSSGGSMMKAAGIAIPALTLAGFGAGAYGLLGGTGAAAGAAPGAGNGAFLGEAAWSPTIADAAGLAGTGADAATSAAWSNGAAGLGGDTLSAMGGGGVLGQVGGMAGDAASWMKANPTLGKLLMSGGMSLASASGGGSSAPAPKTYGPAQQWSSPIQQGLLSNPQQMNPAAITQQRPTGLLAQGQQNDGAWRFLGGK